MKESKAIENGSFKPVIGIFGGASIVAGMTIASGIYYIGSYVLERTHMGLGLSLVCWIVGGIVTLLGGLCFAELGAAMPVAGGMTTYLSRAYGPRFGFVNGYCEFLLTGSGSLAALALAAVTAFQGIFGLNEVVIRIIAIIMILVFLAINLCGVKFASFFENATMVARVIPLALIIILGLTLGKENPDLSLSLVTEGGEAAGLGDILKVIAFGSFASLWAYEGWTNLNIVAEEMRNPKRDLPISIITALIFIMLTYVLFNFAIYRVLPFNEIAGMVASEDVYLGNAVAERLMGGVGKWLVLIGMTIGIVGAVNANVLVLPRTSYAMAKQGYFPRMFKKIDVRTGVPKQAVIGTAVVAIILVIFRNLQDLTDLLVFSSAALNLLTIIAVLVFRKKYPDMERPYKVWGGKATIFITIILFVVLLVNEFIDSPLNSAIGLIIPLSGLLVYEYFKRRNAGKDYDDEKQQEDEGSFE
jgi:APA family basic amino acid/polyamine antiporter